MPALRDHLRNLHYMIHVLFMTILDAFRIFAAQVLTKLWRRFGVFRRDEAEKEEE